MKTRIAFLLLFLFSNLLFAAKAPEPKVDYSADSMIEAESMNMTSKVYYSKGNQRIEMSSGMASIIRKDKNVVWQLMPGNMYMEMPLNSAHSKDPMNMDIEKTPVGMEVVNGIKTTKYKVIGTTSDRKKFEGFFWVTPEDIVIKSDMLLKNSNQKNRILVELKNLKIQKQEPSLFELPKDAKKVSMGGFGNTPSTGANGSKQQMPNVEELMKQMKH